MLTKSINRKSSLRMIQDRVNEIHEIINKVSDGNIISIKNTPPFLTKNIVQTLMLSSNNNDIDRVLMPIVVGGCVSSELKAAASGDLCLRLCANLMNISMGIERSHLDNKSKIIKKDIDRVIGELSKFTRRFCQSDFNIFINNILKNDEIEEIVKISVSLSGVTGKIYTSLSHARHTTIVQSGGFRFNHEIDEAFLLEKKTWSKNNVSCIVIDGFIENISEIYHLLESINKSGNPCVMFVRHMSQEVRSTILTNVRRGVIKIFPISLGFDDETINILNDISIACNTSIISCLTGDLISSATRRDLHIIDRIIIDKTGFTIFNKPDDTLENHLSFLYGKLNQFKSYDLNVKDLYAKRIKSLNALKIDINLGRDIVDRDRYAVEKIDTFLRAMISFSQYGSITSHDFKGILDSVRDDISDEIYFILKESLCDNFEVIPKNSLMLPIAICASLVDKLSNLGVIIFEDR